MRLVTRAQWGAAAPRGDWAYIGSTLGVKVHYEGTEVPADLVGADQHGRCASRVRDIQASHMANTAEGWIDIAYSAMVCPHGFVFEGRGLHHKTGANGNGTLNAGHYAVCGMVGDDGLTEPTADMLGGIRDAIEWFQREGGAGSEIKGHRDGYATSCPGGPLYEWVRAGAPRPTVNPNEEDPLSQIDQETEALLRRIVREEASSVTVRNANAEAWYWWLPYFLTGEVPQAAIDQHQGWVQLIPTVHALLKELPPEIFAQLKTAVAEAVAAEVVHVDVNVRQGG